ncbi:peptide-N4-(N-acetyl-beta-glucosaminyl)asparagine amidase A [Silene latifolia]|uniref:peptide-N4-(N-acetyl-beta- glucosaminyl)asparagine amidase A n=1 Tax=Silene latifolia TaxID=37657 RepID=UPI003D76DF4A
MHPLTLPLLLTTLTLFLQKSTPLPHHFPRATTTTTFNLHAQPPQPPSHPIEFFEVKHPIPRATAPTIASCTHQILTHDFAFTYAREPVHVPYAPPSHCPSSKYSSIVLEWSATCQGRQFDRIFGVWLGGVEVLRGCTAEPTRGGIFWKVKKDVTRYSELFLRKNSDLSLDVYLGNLVDSTYTGVYHVNITVFYYYPVGEFGENGGDLSKNGKNLSEHGGDLGENGENLSVGENGENLSEKGKNSSENGGGLGEKIGNLGVNDGKLNENGEFLIKHGGKLRSSSKILSKKDENGGKLRDLGEKVGNLGENGRDSGVNGGNLSNNGGKGKNLSKKDANLGEKVENLSKNGGNLSKKGGDLGENDGNWADLILPISRDLPLKDGLWFEIENSTDVESKEVVIPRNVYRAVLEVYVSYHENDEFWYSNLPNEYLIANNLTGSGQGNGAFREVLVHLDGKLVGAICPFTVIYTGGINPLLWRPITAIGSFDLPSYDIEITPFLGKLLDGKAHRVGFSVTNALNVWYVDANLHLWLDKKSTVTQGGLLEHDAQPVNLSSRLDFNGLDGKFFTGARRSIASVGWVKSSHGNITTTSTQSFEFENYMVLGKDGNLQVVNQTIEYNTSVSTNVFPLYKIESRSRFPLFLFTDEVDLGNKSYTYQSNVTLGFNEEKIVSSGTEIKSSSLRNFQKAEGDMVVNNNLVSGGVGSTHQVYKYNEDNGGFCYFRNVSSYNYTIIHDQERKTCKSATRNYVSGSDDSAILLRE